MTRKVVLDSDILASHLTAPPSEFTALRSALSEYFCYTTVFNAVELFAAARTASEKRKVEDVLSSLKILGMNGRNAKKFAALEGFGRASVPLETMIAGICIEARLPLMTARRGAYGKYRNLKIVRAAAPHAKRGRTTLH
jgi:predicted nucleic acid-binding protein